ncbi:MAG: hypothetical protein GY906_35940, partial [bacterium]|nr:hypothetical protein [bacterium]
MRVSAFLSGWLRQLTILLFAFCVVPLGACTYHRAYIDYPEGTGEMPLRAGAFSGEALGPVRGGEGGAIWKDCTKVAQASVWVMIQQTQAMGGNAIGNIRWFPDRPLR